MVVETQCIASLQPFLQPYSLFLLIMFRTGRDLSLQQSRSIKIFGLVIRNS